METCGQTWNRIPLIIQNFPYLRGFLSGIIIHVSGVRIPPPLPENGSIYGIFDGSPTWGAVCVYARCPYSVH